MSFAYEFIVKDSGERVDRFLCSQLPNHSRSVVRSWIDAGHVLRNDQLIKASHRVKAADVIRVTEILAQEDSVTWQAQAGDLVVVHEDNHMLVVDKPAGLVVHPAAGNMDNTLANRLLAYLPSVAQLPRAGIVHRLDKDTSGLLVIAKTLVAHTALVSALQARSIERHYTALVYGAPDVRGMISSKIGRDPHNRQRQAVVSRGGKDAVTHFSRTKIITPCAQLAVKLDTGRTHQIRVHMQHIGHAVVGDQTYKSPVNWKHVPDHVRDILTSFPRQALHATKLVVPVIDSDKSIKCHSPMPQDMQQLVMSLSANN